MLRWRSPADHLQRNVPESHPNDRIFQVPWPEEVTVDLCDRASLTSFWKNTVAHIYPVGAPRIVAALADLLNGLYYFIEYRNYLLCVIRNLEKMITVSYCTERISILVLDHSRKNVARLTPIDCTKVRQLAMAFEEALKEMLQYEVSEANLFMFSSQFHLVSEHCRQMLSSLGLNDLPSDHGNLWRCTASILDIAVASYVGAHIRSLKTNFTSPVRIHPYFIFRKRSFLCLGNFLNGRQAWVLEATSKNHPPLSESSLYISTDAAIFADIWGPMWESRLASDPTKIIRYNVGNGMILPWQHSTTNRKESVQEIQSNEIFCHWISDVESKTALYMEGPSEETLSPVDILLIGANVQLGVNPDCKCPLGPVKQRLRDSGCLHEAGTIAKSHYKDADTVQFQVGWSGVTAGIQRSYKLRERTWKQSLVERWKSDPEGRNPRVLEYRIGVEVSVCTQNARRRRLITMLGSNDAELSQRAGN